MTLSLHHEAIVRFGKQSAALNRLLASRVTGLAATAWLCFLQYWPEAA
jgi:hypothetical protein